jgi:polyisoprenoid-binding protein YceI
MKLVEIRRGLIACSALCAIGVFLSASAAHRPPQLTAAASPAEVVLSIDPEKSTVRYTVGSTLHAVHGTFALRPGALRFDPATGKAGGEIVADSASGQSGNAGRDKRMHQEILESGHYAEIVFRPDRVEGNIPPQSASTVKVHGMFVLHGVEHELVVPVQIKLEVGHWEGTARFSVPYIQWGLKNPSNFFLKVDKSVDIEVSIAGVVEQP